MANAQVPVLTGDSDHDIDELQRVISLGGDVDHYKRALQYYLRNNVKIEPYIDPALQNLPAAVAKRVVTLDSYLKMPEYEVDIINIKAVKAAYIDGSLEIREGHWTFWVGGRKKSDYVNQPMAIGIPHEVFQQWIKEENGYRVWMERPGGPFLQMASYSSYLPQMQTVTIYIMFISNYLVQMVTEASLAMCDLPKGNASRSSIHPNWRLGGYNGSCDP